jgi:hypothetical protein
MTVKWVAFANKKMILLIAKRENFLLCKLCQIFHVALILIRDNLFEVKIFKLFVNLGF